VSIDFTSDELFFIEKLVDQQSAVAGKNLHDVSVAYVQLKMLGSEASPNLFAASNQTLRELLRSRDIADSIRSKLEVHRNAGASGRAS